MKKFGLASILLLTISLFITGCSKDEENEKILSITFISDGYVVSDKEFSSLSTERSFESISKDGYEFVGWFIDYELKIAFDSNNWNEYFKKSKMNLYASWRKIMKNNVITMIGLADGLSIINPIFSWDNNYDDQSFQVKIMTNNQTILNEDLNITQFKIENDLEYDKTYVIEVCGKESGHTVQKEFTTIKVEDSSNDPITLSDPLMDNMVLQREEEILISGRGPKYKLITVEFGTEIYYCASNATGDFNVMVPKHQGSFNPIDIQLSSSETNFKKVTNVLIGDVYLFAGQSNMQWPTINSDYLPSDVTTAIDSNVRYFSQDVATSTEELSHVKNGKWFTASKEVKNYEYYSAIAFMAGSILGKDLKSENVPLGILSAYQGNTNIADWMSDDYYHGNCSTKHLYYNAMVSPLKNAKIKGVVWYQGCNNSASGGDYLGLLKAFFANYRNTFSNDNLPFYVIGLCCYDGDSGNNYDFSFVRESQAKACEEDENAYFISTCDDGNPNYIHPTQKRYICERVRKSILSSIYQKHYYAEGPSYASHTVDGNVVTITLNNAEGLYAFGQISGLYLAGEDGKYFEAVASIVDEKIVASSMKVANPVYIKYGFAKSPFVNIFNKDDFAITPFRTDEYNLNIDVFDYSESATYSNHPDGSLMTTEVVNENGNIGLKVTKQADGKGYGSIRLDKWGMIAYEPLGFKITIKGSNSGATISFRAVEGPSYEIWAYRIKDDFIGIKSFTVPISELTCILNKNDNLFNPQSISYIELMVEGSGSISFTLLEARFVTIKRTAPTSFLIANILEQDVSVNINLSKASFADKYRVVVSTDGINYSNPLFNEESNSLSINIDKTKFQQGVTYYIKAIAINELGETIATNSGTVFYLHDDQKLIVCNFDFLSDSVLQSYISSNMKVHSGLESTLNPEGGINVVSKGQGWQNFIFVIETGSNNGFNNLTFKGDFNNYQGQVIIQLVDANYQIFEFTLDLSKQISGDYSIPLSSFLMNKTSPFDGRSLIWISFNFNDSVGGSFLFDDCNLTK